MQMDLFGNVPQIVIDVHETGGKRMNSVKHLMSMLDKNNITYTVEKIPIGDVLGLNGIAIERKTVSDLVNTLKGSASGVPRLSKQMDALMEGKGYFVTMERASYIHPSSLDALIESIREKGIKIIEGFNALHSAGLLYGILTGDDQTKGSKGQRLPVIRTRKDLETVNDEQEFFIAGFPSVNVVRAKSLLEKFGSPMEVLTRTDEWAEVSGIGPKTVASAKRLLFGKYEKPTEV
ncbi:MAG: ERCC4 domain-containing protein, partial [Candidatus Thorarchaeota archaeon]